MKSKAAVATLAVVDSEKPIDLAKLEGRKFAPSANLDALTKRVIEEMLAIEQAEHSAACRAVLLGCVIHQIKENLGHGKFGPWKAKHFGEAKARQVNYWMALAEKFSRSQKLLLPEFVAMPQLTLQLEAPTKSAADALNKVRAFIGKRSLNELLEYHGIKRRGGAQTTAPAGEPTLPPPASRSPEAEAYQQLVDAATDAEKALLDEVRWSLVTPELAAQVEPLLKRLLNRFHERLLQARHEASP